MMNHEWDFSISSVNKKSLPTAIWWIVCQNIDVWCAYPAQDKLKDFLSLLIQSSLPSSKNNFSVSREHVFDKHGHMKTIRPNQISVELFRNTALYEQSVSRFIDLKDMHIVLCYYLFICLMQVEGEVNTVARGQGPS